MSLWKSFHGQKPVNGFGGKDGHKHSGLPLTAQHGSFDSAGPNHESQDIMKDFSPRQKHAYEKKATKQPDMIYYRLIQKKRETDKKVEEIRQKKLEEETHRLPHRRHKLDDSGKDFYERMIEAQKRRDQRLEEMRREQMRQYTFRPHLPRSPYGPKRSPDSESVFDRLYRTSTASSSAYTTTDTSMVSSHRSSTASSSSGMSARLVALYQDGVRRAKKMPKSQKDEDELRELALLQENKKDFTFKPKVKWKDEIGVDRRQENGRIGIYPRHVTPPAPPKGAKKPLASIPRSPPREIVFGAAPQLHLTTTPLEPGAKLHIAEAQKAEPWITPPRPIHTLFPRGAPSILDHERSSQVAPTDFAVVSPLRDSACFLHRASKETYITRLLSKDIDGDTQSDGETTVEENSAAYGSEGVISDLKTEYGSI